MTYKKKPTEIRPLQIEVNDNFEESLGRFKALFQKEKIVSLLKEKSRYEKPSEKKRRKRREAAERQFINNLRQKQISSGEWQKRQKKKDQKKKVENDG